MKIKAIGAIFSEKSYGGDYLLFSYGSSERCIENKTSTSNESDNTQKLSSIKLNIGGCVIISQVDKNKKQVNKIICEENRKSNINLLINQKMNRFHLSGENTAFVLWSEENFKGEKMRINQNYQIEDGELPIKMIKSIQIIKQNYRIKTKESNLILYRYYKTYENGALEEHYFDTNKQEIGATKVGEIVNGYTFQGIIGGLETTQKDGTVPLYRILLHSEKNVSGKIIKGQNTLLTTSAVEKDTVLKNTANVDKGILGYCYLKATATTLPLYRYFKKTTENHYFTPNYHDLENGKDGYIFEGITCCILQ